MIDMERNDRRHRTALPDEPLAACLSWGETLGPGGRNGYCDVSVGLAGGDVEPSELRV